MPDALDALFDEHARTWGAGVRPEHMEHATQANEDDSFVRAHLPDLPPRTSRPELKDEWLDAPTGGRNPDGTPELVRHLHAADGNVRSGPAHAELSERYDEWIAVAGATSHLPPEQREASRYGALLEAEYARDHAPSTDYQQAAQAVASYMQQAGMPLRLESAEGRREFNAHVERAIALHKEGSGEPNEQASHGITGADPATAPPLGDDGRTAGVGAGAGGGHGSPASRTRPAADPAEQDAMPGISRREDSRDMVGQIRRIQEQLAIW